MASTAETAEKVHSLAGEKYKYGFVTDIESDMAPKGLSEDTVRFISDKKSEPQWLLDWRLKSFRAWTQMEEPKWAKIGFPAIDYQDAYYYSAPKQKITPEEPGRGRSGAAEDLREAGHPAARAGAAGRASAVDAVFDSVSVATTFKKKLGEKSASSSARSRMR